MMFYRMGMVRLFEVSLRRRSTSDKTTIYPWLFCQRWSPDHGSMTYKLELLKNCWVDKFAYLGRVLEDIVYAWTYWQRAGQIKFHSLLTAHHLIGIPFLITESDKRMRLLTRLYSSCLLYQGQAYKSKSLTGIILFLRTPDFWWCIDVALESLQ